MSETLDYLRTMAAFPVAFRRYQAEPPLTLEAAQHEVRRSLDERETRFLAMAEQSIYSVPHSPYLALLRHAGCELPDLCASVRRHGLEGALRALREAGVYVTLEEFKGRQPIVRDGLHHPAHAADFDNPRTPQHFGSHTSGTTGPAMNVGINLAYLRAQAASHVLTLAAHGLLGAPTAIWRGILPDAGLRNMLRSLALGKAARHWYTPFGWRDSRYWLKYDLATVYVILWMRLAGARVPWPEVLTVTRADVVMRWMAQALKAEGRCLLETGVSRGTRVCVAALEAGLHLKGAGIIAGGETPTPSKIASMRRAGANYIVNYGLVEAGNVASGCAAADDGSDAHLFTDGFALIDYRYRRAGRVDEVPAFNLTTLHPSTPKVMLNVQMGDYGVVEERHCGCALEACGYVTHLRQIRSDTLLTGEGVTLIASDVAHVLEEVLPQRCGGTLLDYQLVEAEDERGLTRIELLVHPRLADVDEALAVRVVLDTLRRASPMTDAAGMIWQRTGVVTVRRAAPIWTGHGKFPAVLTRRRLPRDTA